MLDEAVRNGEEQLPGPVRLLVRNAARHQTLTLSAGVAFFGLISLAPAFVVAFAVVRLLLSPEALDAMVDTMRDGVGGTLALGDLLEQMEGRAGHYVGFSFLVLLWPATTLASGWTRALDAIAEDEDSTAGVRGLKGRLQGLIVGLFLLTVWVVIVAGTVYGAGVAADHILTTVLVAGLLGVGTLFCFCVLVYRWLPTRSRPVRSLWPGAVLATIGVILSTAGLGALLVFAGALEDSYPPALSTAVVLGLWLYGLNTSLLLGDEYNNARHGDTAA